MSTYLIIFMVINFNLHFYYLTYAGCIHKRILSNNDNKISLEFLKFTSVFSFVYICEIIYRDDPFPLFFNSDQSI